MQPPGAPVKIAGIARRQGIPQKFLELILASLKQGGFVESRRGADGGYLLARAADGIRVGDVLRFVEGNRADKGLARPGSPFAEMWRDVEHAVGAVLDGLTFAEVARRCADRRSVYVPNWEI